MKDTDITEQLPFQLSVCSRMDVEKFKASRATHLLSIDNPGDPTTTPCWLTGTHWHVEFHDIESDMEAARFKAVAPVRADVEKVLDHATSCLEISRTSEVHLLVHCMEGASRSTAAVYAILCMVLGIGKEIEALNSLIKIKPDSFPNKLVVQLADDILGRNGKMLEALRPIRNQVNEIVDELIVTMEKRMRRKSD